LYYIYYINNDFELWYECTYFICKIKNEKHLQSCLNWIGPEESANTHGSNPPHLFHYNWLQKVHRCVSCGHYDPPIVLAKEYKKPRV